MSESNNLIISTKGLTKSYDGKPVLNSLDLKVPKNSIFGFLGPNGAGKTTTIKLILGLIQPTGGSCEVFGMDAFNNSVDIRHRTGYLAQDPRYYEHMTARETLRFTARFFFKGPKKEVESRIEETLEMAGLDDKADRPIKGFSGGERQRLGIAQAQINNPDLLILDEPAASLDPMGRRDVLGLMKKMQSETTIFYSTHILDDVQRVSDMVAILNKGNLVAQAPIEELLGSKENAVYNLVIKGDATNVSSLLLQQPWVSSVNAVSPNGYTTLTVSVSDDSKAERNILKVAMADENIVIVEYGRKKYELEDVFMKMVEG
ncbi:ABC transporter ATP-binding protein [Methanocella sp. CWC-04]|uniref:ABC transporter ATP-binding protein n=2 Tax=Methanooceanicella nereidis TaxID=2052831 RepID=A0AAP2RCT5_9EURY|nr:ABC transporter ATP-binding protein [Methanocella sp. CWC-04]